METKLLFHNENSRHIYFEGDYVDMDNSVEFETLPRIGEKIILNDDLEFNEFTGLDEKQINYFETFFKENYTRTRLGYEFIVFDIVHFPGGKYTWICMKPKLNKGLNI
ncbi:hypothetical protein [Maribacter sp. ACAM166]|uniref:hypothetical protein n=1 Tax=Maribacter sp. ACAM166 TaxID=2508996 RepID=UPI0010FD6AAC|nr:hypothetical protein [Maribacter sp. ACAM166]TLP70499.1 hypothetical protein ES765_21190 [Maribacter sp. ACAM166]